jgi:hypothetical protein
VALNYGSFPAQGQEQRQNQGRGHGTDATSLSQSQSQSQSHSLAAKRGFVPAATSSKQLQTTAKAAAAASSALNKAPNLADILSNSTKFQVNKVDSDTSDIINSSIPTENIAERVPTVFLLPF